MKYIYYIFREIRNLFEYYIIPSISIVLPQPIYYFIFKIICRHTFFYKDYVLNSYENAKRIISVSKDLKSWNQNVKLLILTDISDFWLAWLRPKKAIKLLGVSGDWSNEKGFIGLSCHWGTGLTSLLHLKYSGISPYFVFVDEKVDFSDLSFSRGFYNRLRVKYLHNISGDIAITTGGGGYDKIKNTVSIGQSPVILFDAPQFDKSSSFKMTIFNHSYKIASGFVKLICKEDIPFQLYSVNMDFSSGIKTLNISGLQELGSEEVLIAQLSAYLEDLLKINPELWFFWRHSILLLHDENETIE